MLFRSPICFPVTICAIIRRVNEEEKQRLLLKQRLAIQDAESSRLQSSKQQLEQIRARVEANKAEWATIKRVNEEEKQRLLLKQRLAIQEAESIKLQSVSPAIPLIAATATQNIKPIDSSSIIRFREETQKAGR